jgi:Cof subfamily protein (haloacid dehalogenase superfamily)
LKNIQIVFLDLDGTIHHIDDGVHEDDLISLRILGEAGIVRVLATGRNLFSVESVLPEDFPIDYLIFSTGAGIMRWKDRELLHSSTMESTEVKRIADILLGEKVTFMLHMPVPDNHKFYFVKTKNISGDFYKRLQIYKSHYGQLHYEDLRFLRASQFLCMLPNNHEYFEQLSMKIEGVKIIKTSSPLGKDTLWLEIFPADVSKGHAAKWLCDLLHIRYSNTMAVGNDYNDLDMLEFVNHPFVVSNAPPDLLSRFPVVNFQTEAGFTEAIQRIEGIGQMKKDEMNSTESK